MTKTVIGPWYFLIPPPDGFKPALPSREKTGFSRLIFIINIDDIPSRRGWLGNASVALAIALGGPAVGVYKRRDLSLRRRFQSCFGRAKMAQMGKLDA
jgi:hypothetical protein